MADNDNDLSVALPDGLRRQFADVRRRLWRVETIIASCSVIAGLIVSLLALFISDRLWNTTPVWRLLFLLIGLAAVIAAFVYWARRWVWQRRTLLELANLVQKRYRRLGDRLLGVVELSQEQRHLANFSPALYHAAIHQVAEEARQYDFCESVSARPAEKFALAAGAAVVCWVSLVIALPQASWNSFLRWFAPTANIPRYTLVDLQGLPKELIVAHGEPFVISGSVAYRSIWKPNRVSGRFPSMPKIEGKVDSGKIRLEIPGQVENGLLRVQAGDAVAEIQVQPVYRPSLRELAADIQLPDYLRYPDQSQTVQSGTLQAVEGSRIAFRGTTSRALSRATMQSDGSSAAPLSIENDHFTSAPVRPEGIASYTINWKDELGLSNAAPLRLSVAMQKDAPPSAELPGLPHESAMLVSDVLRIRAEASDDYGIWDMGLTWDIVSDAPLTESTTSEIKMMAPSPRVKKLSRVFMWSPRVYRIPADSTVELQGYARDYYPERERSRTSVYRIHVLSPEEHAELVRQKLEDVMARVEEVTRLQEKVAANLHDVQDNQKLPDAQKSARIGQSKDDQLQNSTKLDNLTQQAVSAVQEAMKNPIFPEKTIRQWNQLAQQWQKLAQSKMKEAAASMQSAQQSSSSQQKDLADASQKADDILKALEEMQGKATKHLDDLQALTLSERLHKVSTQEKEMGALLFQTAPDTIGLPPADLPDKFKKVERALATDQGHAQKQSETLQNEISRFYERTQKTNYGAVSREMKDSRTSDELDRLAGMITDNIGIQASTNLGLWSDRFQKWSDALQPKTQDSGGQGSGKSQSNDLTEQLIALLRLRENEMNLRDETSVLDQQKGDPSSFKDRANSLADNQKKLGGDLEQIRKKVDLAPLESAFNQTTGAMDQTQSILRKPETGKPAEDSEVKAIDLLSDLVNLINEQAQRSNQKQSSSSPSSSEEMQFLLRMMQNTANAKAMAIQPAGTLNRNGGTTDKAANPVSGNTSGKSSATREIDKASGVIENSPVEFRDALDNYFHGIEQTKD